MFLRQIFDPYLAQYSYLIGCQKTGEALIVDPERDIDQYLSLAKSNDLKITAVAETHIHADFVSGAQEFAKDPKVRLYLSAEGGKDWQYNWPKDRSNTFYLKDQEIFQVGNIAIQALHTPGHTPEHLSFLVTDQGGGANQPVALLTGDFLFVSDVGRPDLLESAAGIKNVMEPSAKELRRSLVDALTAYPDFLQILPGHGAGSACGKSLGSIPSSTLGYERLFNSPFKLAITNEQAFVKEILTDQPEPPRYFARMKKVNKDGITVTNGIPKVKHLSLEELGAKIFDHELKIVDLRNNTQDFNHKHLNGSLNAPLRSPLFSAALGSYLNPEDQILLVLESFEDLDLAVRQLYRIGYDNFVGWILWSEVLEMSSDFFSMIPQIPLSDYVNQTGERKDFLIDVRKYAEYRQGHLVGAKSFPYTKLAGELVRIPKEEKIYIHCATGKRAGIATAFLKSKGYDVIHLSGGLPKENLVSTS